MLRSWAARLRPHGGSRSRESEVPWHGAATWPGGSSAHRPSAATTLSPMHTCRLGNKFSLTGCGFLNNSAVDPAVWPDTSAVPTAATRSYPSLSFIDSGYGGAVYAFSSPLSISSGFSNPLPRDTEPGRRFTAGAEAGVAEAGVAEAGVTEARSGLAAGPHNPKPQSLLLQWPWARSAAGAPAPAPKRRRA
jgi:hypothetical protein